MEAKANCKKPLAPREDQTIGIHQGMQSFFCLKESTGVMQEKSLPNFQIISSQIPECPQFPNSAKQIGNTTYLPGQTLFLHLNVILLLYTDPLKNSSISKCLRSYLTFFQIKQRKLFNFKIYQYKIILIWVNNSISRDSCTLPMTVTITICQYVLKGSQCFPQ